MPQIVTRTLGPTAKGALLTNAEVDTNFININTAIDNLYLSKIQPSLSVDWTKKPTASALTSAGWTISRAGEITSFGLPTKAAENLFSHSQDFGNAAWGKSAITVGAVTDESGLVGSAVVATAAAGYHGLWTAITNTNIGSATYRVRFLCKAAGYTKCIIGDGSNLRAGAAFDLAAGVVIGTGYGAGYVSHSIYAHELGGGLYWCELVMTSAAAGVSWSSILTGYPDSGATLNAAGAQYTGDDVSGIEVYAAQLQQGFDGDYIPTTTDPITLYEPQLVTTAANELAYQHNESGECIGLVQYPSDTNLILQSQDLSNASWAKSVVAVTASKRKWAGNVPFWRISKTDSVASRSLNQSVATTVSAGAKYSATIALMADQWSGINSLHIGMSGISNGFWGATGDGAATIISGPGSITQASGCLFLFGGLSATVPTLVRITRTYPLADTTIGLHFYPGNSSNATPGAAILATRVHLSASPRLTPYIPTTTAAVTRGAQSITFGGSAFAAVNNPKEGTLLAKASVEDLVFDSGKILIQVQTGSPVNAANRVCIASGSGVTSTPQAIVTYAATTQAAITLGSMGTTPTAVAAAFAFNSVQFSVAGTLSAVDTSANVPPVERLVAGDPSQNSWHQGLIQRTELYPRAMTSSELAAVTTPGVL